MSEQLNEPTFAVVWAVRAGGPGFEVEGIFTNDDDAEELRQQLESLTYVRVATRQRVSRRAIKRILIEDRMGELSESLLKLESYMTERKGDQCRVSRWVNRLFRRGGRDAD